MMAQCRRQYIDFVAQSNIEHCLETTCKLLMSNNEDHLQNAWISLLAKAGEVMTAENVKPWLLICDDVLRQIEQDHLDAAEVLVLSVKFCLLFHRIKYRFRQPLQIQTLRSKIIEFFPDDAELTEKGIKTYARILPTAAEEKPLAHKVLVGLTSIWTDGKFEESRVSLEYLSRRKLLMDLPTGFPYDMKDNDFMWFLWGAILCFYKQHANVQKIWWLFSYDYKKTYKAERIGLLLGCPWAMHPNSQNTLIWSDKELLFINTIESQAPTMWLDYVQLHTPCAPPASSQSSKKSSKSSATTALSSSDGMFLDFIPRAFETPNIGNGTGSGANNAETRTIQYADKKRSSFNNL